MTSVRSSTLATVNVLWKAIVPAATTVTLYSRPSPRPPIAVPDASYVTTEPDVIGKLNATVLAAVSTEVMRSLGGVVAASFLSSALTLTSRPAVIVVPDPTEAVTIGSTIDSAYAPATWMPPPP